MSKLSPRPLKQEKLFSWDDLNSQLLANFNMPGIDYAVIDLQKYDMSKEEIIVEAEKQGYKVIEQAPHHLRFE
ncbi:hypothetical protein [Sutcliffiella rhizosphaerae]|uniref:Uncharacterized protein n=1 Tax=Sutcliffiella rhizosphaerae TaxID=2880967 RepID=A0ABM8YM67_9BACI|nr:hypothetical protein [Sutcliffiella rhizosphaerae]CAG9620843.1 hypothetical protein BACCIP111883_01614 [Sutcliffiella rhizosphaerae]